MPASKAKQAQTAARRAKAIAMRTAGIDWQTITEQLDYPNRHTACRDVRRGLAQWRQEEDAKAEELEHMTVLRYDRLQAAFWAKALKGDPRAAEVVLKCLAGRARIEGTEAPVKLNVEAQRLGDEILAMIESAAKDDGEAP
jgi:hypothetical protein